MRSSTASWLALAASAVVACSGPIAASPTNTPAPTVVQTATPASATPSPTTGCQVTIEPEVAAPGGWSVVVGSGFKSDERIEWSQAAEDGSLAASWDTDSFDLMTPDNRGGFGFGLGAPGEEAIGHTIIATISSESCTTRATFRVEAENEQTAPLPPTAVETCTAERTALDRVDDTDEHQIHLIYALPSDGVDRRLDEGDQIKASMDHIETFLREHLDGHSLRIDTCDDRVDVTFLQMPRTTRDYALMRAGFTQGLALDLVRKGFRYGQKLYVVIWDGLAQWARLGDGCGGEAGYQGVAALFQYTVYGDSCPDLGQELPIGEPDTGLVHEVIHMLGVPAQCAAHVSEDGHVIDDPSDLMYGIGHTTADAIDADHDDYYLHDIADCPDLADSAFLDPLPTNPELPVDWPAN